MLSPIDKRCLVRQYQLYTLQKIIFLSKNKSNSLRIFFAVTNIYIYIIMNYVTDHYYLRSI